MTITVTRRDREALYDLCEVRIEAPSSDLFPSQQGLRLRAVFEAREGIRLIENEKELTPGPTDIMTLSGTVRLTFCHQVGGTPIRHIDLPAPTPKLKIGARSRTDIAVTVSQWDIEDLNMARGGQDLYIGWSIDVWALALLPDIYTARLIRLTDAPYTNTDWLHLSPQLINQHLIVPSRLPERLFLEFPTKMLGAQLREKAPAEIHNLIDVLNSASDELRHGLEALRMAKTSSDYGGVMGGVRQTVERVRDQLRGQRDGIARALYVESGITGNTGAEEAALELIQSLENVLDGVFGLCSKPPHGTTRTQRLHFTMHPDAYDAQSAVALALSVVSYIVGRLERYTTSRR